ncbi:MAG: shikimate dehydrogenase [Nitrospirae bacterium]|nr:shikimate dehydrogenase [Nitrospirota bacterium]
MITARTITTGLFGYPVEHSLSPAMHNAGFKHLGIDYRYLAFSVSPEMLGDAVRGIRAMNFAGVNVTIPHKENVIAFLDEVDEEAKFIGAVNTIKNDGGRLLGYNTDGRGFMRSLEESGISPGGKKVFIIGAGGASRAISYYLCKETLNEDGRVSIFDVDGPKLQSLVSDLRHVSPYVYAESGLEKVSESDVVINATPLGLKASDPLPVDVALLKGTQTVCDVIYKETPFLEKAGNLGCVTKHGLGMLLWQGVIAFEIWTGLKPPVEVMRNALVEGFKNH